MVLAVGLWLRFDPETVELLTGDGAPDTFFIGTCSLHTHTFTDHEIWCITMVDNKMK